MRGTAHTTKSLALMSEVKRQQYRDGAVRIRRYKLSASERAIGDALRARGIEVRTQFHIKGVPFLYDFLLPAFNVIIEYQGDWWHANPARYASGTMLSFHGKLVMVDSIWRRDVEKKSAAEAHGYRFEAIWESDFKRRGMAAVMCRVVP
jgi:G:T-mismatch repair DNA endonuclease (very short patch repair protein)